MQISKLRYGKSLGARISLGFLMVVIILIIVSAIGITGSSNKPIQQNTPSPSINVVKASPTFTDSAIPTLSPSIIPSPTPSPTPKSIPAPITSQPNSSKSETKTSPTQEHAVTAQESSTISGAGVVKKSTNDICHTPGTKYYDKTKNFTPYNTVDECLASGGRLPNK